MQIIRIILTDKCFAGGGFDQIAQNCLLRQRDSTLEKFVSSLTYQLPLSFITVVPQVRWFWGSTHVVDDSIAISSTLSSPPNSSL